MPKRRVFDLELPEDEEGTAGPEAGPGPGPAAASGPRVGLLAPDRPRRGPMASAITETGVALSDRAATLAAIRDENDRLAHAHVSARALGLVAERVPLEAIDTVKLVRDRRRKLFDDGTLDELKTSLQDVGLSNPIRLERAAHGRFELIQGWRRLSAFRALLEETGDEEAWGTIPALVTDAGEGLEVLYRRMVDENMVRAGISFAEMAQLAENFASLDPREEMTAEKAVATLFRSAGYQKRSYIRGFLPLVRRLGDVLRFPEEIPRALGLRLSQRIDEDDGITFRIRADLKGWDNRSVEDELAVLRRAAEDGAPEAPPDREDEAPAPPPRPRVTASGPAPQTVVTLRHDRAGTVSCAASKGRLEIRLDRDMTEIDRARLEDALRAFLDRLG
ncbi:ParB/RepB/Spo0J family partition protein [Wenxinia marina]|uniref:Plasmid replication protein RepB n=1 Tax=Wenxinia marina DSM 24838 TaxID=1123501 RepID=A0A0D0QA79_9RHOB|nr:ParB N-terminal domain-containing protein [Wenxinia marina]KIQ71379.1 Plasmid replication protein RepB [Wenxinia marina DSM 24838]GGL79063.1 replication protein [Wenxinia marina]